MVLLYWIALHCIALYLFKKYETCTLFLSSYGNTSGSLGEREMPWENMFSIPFREHREEEKENNLLTLIIKMLILYAPTIITSTAPANSVFPPSN